MPESVDRERLRAFLTELGRAFHGPARLILSGGESLVWRGLRGATRAVDVKYEVASEHVVAWVRELRAVSQRLGVLVEEASPGHFVPLPPGSDSRREWIERFGRIEVSTSTTRTRSRWPSSHEHTRATSPTSERCWPPTCSKPNACANSSRPSSLAPARSLSASTRSASDVT